MLQLSSRSIIQQSAVLLGSIALATGLVYIYDRYQSPDRIDSTPMIQGDMMSVDTDMPDTEIELSRFFEGEMMQLLYGMHGSPERDDYATRTYDLCKYFSVCERISVPHDHSDQDRYMYTALPIYMMHYADLYMDQPTTLQNHLYKLSVVDSPGRRGYANSDTILINLHDINHYREYLEIVVHELAHVIDLGVVDGEMRRVDTTYTHGGQAKFALDDPSIDFYQLSWDDERTRSAGQSQQDFCSGYGQRNPFEDFAECFNLYTNHHALFVHLLPRSRTLRDKYTYIKRLMDGFYIFDHYQAVDRAGDPEDFYVFDTSKIWE